MKPGQIQVFDGLRLTTEHMNHLQGSFHSAIQDLRQILGLGRIHAGFELIKDSETAVTVQPGLAFDYQKNRVICDEPKTLEVSFNEGESKMYVCVKYEQIEDGLVEDRPTLIWDTCSILTKLTMPEPGENLIPIAVLIEEEGDSFGIFPISELERLGKQDVEESVDDEIETADQIDESEPAETQVSVNSNETAVPETPENSKEPEPDISEEELDSTESASEITENEITAEPESEETSVDPFKGQVVQGVIHLGNDNKPLSLQTLLSEPLRQKLNSATNNGDLYELKFRLAETELPLNFRPASITCHTIINASTLFNLNQDDDGSNQSQEGGLSKISYNMVGQGEVTFDENKITQFGISTIHTEAIVAEEFRQSSKSELMESGIAILTFSVNKNFMSSLPEENGWPILQNIKMSVALEQSDNSKIMLTLNLFWKGEITEEKIELIENQPLILNWESTVAWKATGGLSFNHS